MRAWERKGCQRSWGFWEKGGEVIDLFRKIWGTAVELSDKIRSEKGVVRVESLWSEVRFRGEDFRHGAIVVGDTVQGMAVNVVEYRRTPKGTVREPGSKGEKDLSWGHWSYPGWWQKLEWRENRREAPKPSEQWSHYRTGVQINTTWNVLLYRRRALTYIWNIKSNFWIQI